MNFDLGSTFTLSLSWLSCEMIGWGSSIPMHHIHGLQSPIYFLVFFTFGNVHRKIFLWVVNFTIDVHSDGEVFPLAEHIFWDGMCHKKFLFLFILLYIFLFCNMGTLSSLSERMELSFNVRSLFFCLILTEEHVKLSYLSYVLNGFL